MFVKPSRLIRSAIVLKPSMLLHIHHALRNRKYRALFSHKRKRKPGPQGPPKELIDSIIDAKRRKSHLHLKRRVIGQHFGFSNQFSRSPFPLNPNGRGMFNERREIPPDNCSRKIPSVLPRPLWGERNGKRKSIIDAAEIR
jgi:hypothetical protein